LKDEVDEKLSRKNLQKQKKNSNKKIRMKFNRKKPKEDEIWMKKKTF
jgi:hypothetical protein